MGLLYVFMYHHKNLSYLNSEGGRHQVMDKLKTQSERRKHKRVEMADDILVFNETTFGQIINISQGGLAFRFLTNKELAQESLFRIGILNSGSGFFLENIPCKTITSIDSAPIHPTGSTIVRRNGVMFTDLSQEQIHKLENFLADNAKKISH